ncbi:MAG: hypothetical protein ABJB09_07035 [Verrucomicrobiota bacterium]
MDDELKKQFSKWNPDVSIPPRFQAEVWQRIAAREAAGRNSLWRRVQEWILTELPKPQYATALIALGLTLSIGVAHVQAQQTNREHWRQLEARYVSSINPVAQAAALE